MDLATEILLYVSSAVIIHILVFYFVMVTKKRGRNIKDKHVVVTGGSSGIGLWIAVTCAKQGAHVTLVARNVQLLEKALKVVEQHRQDASQRLSFKSIDLTKSYDEVAKSLEEVEEQNGPIYMLVNCAGMAICGVFEEITPEDAQFLMDVNYKTAYNCTRYVLPKMKHARDGIIVITGSQASLLGIYGYGPYAAAKFALRGMAETIAMEASHLGVSVTLALPADTDTPGFENEEKTKPEETKIISGSGGLHKPEEVAKKIVSDALNENFFSILGTESWVVTLLCSGMAPWGGFLFTVLQAFALIPLRIISYFVRGQFTSIVRKCAAQKKLRQEVKEKKSN